MSEMNFTTQGSSQSEQSWLEWAGTACLCRQEVFNSHGQLEVFL